MVRSVRLIELCFTDGYRGRGTFRPPDGGWRLFPYTKFENEKNRWEPLHFYSIGHNLAERVTDLV